MLQKATNQRDESIPKRRLSVNTDEQTYHLINDYLGGELKGRELDKFKTELRENSALQETVARQQQIIQAIQTVRESEIKKFLRDKTAKKKGIPLSLKLKTMLATAAVITFFAVAIFILKPFSTANKPVFTQQKIDEKNILPRSQKVADLAVVDSATNANQQPETQILALDIASAPADDEQTPPEILNNTAPTSPQQEQVASNNDAGTDGDNIEENKATANDEQKESRSAEKPVEIDDIIIVRSDEMLYKKAFAVYAVDLDFTEDKKQGSSLDKQKIEVSKDYSDAENKVTDEEAPMPATTKRKITVEYWKSVVNYRGYQYNGALVKFYGIDHQQKLLFKELDDRLYTEIEGKHFFLEKNTKYNRLVEVTNPTLLKILRE